MKFKVTYYRAGKARRFLFPTIEAARAYCAKVHKITGLVLGIELA